MQKFLLLIFLSLTVSLMNCATFRKADAGLILRKCESNIQSIQLDDVEIREDLFPSSNKDSKIQLPNSQIVGIAEKLWRGQLTDSIGLVRIVLAMNIVNRSEDTLWMDSAHGSVNLDSINQFHWTTIDPVTIVPSKPVVMNLFVDLPIKSSTFKILETNGYVLKGILLVRTDREQDMATPLDFVISKVISEAEKEELLQSAMQSVREQVLGSWVKNSF